MLHERSMRRLSEQLVRASGPRDAHPQLTVLLAQLWMTFVNITWYVEAFIYSWELHFSDFASGEKQEQESMFLFRCPQTDFPLKLPDYQNTACRPGWCGSVGWSKDERATNPCVSSTPLFFSVFLSAPTTMPSFLLESNEKKEKENTHLP